MNLFAATIGGGVNLSTDYGDSWTPVNLEIGNRTVFSLVVNNTNRFAGIDDGVFLSPSMLDYNRNDLTNAINFYMSKD